MKHTIIHIALIGLTLLSLNACSTIAGAGADIQRAGQVIEGEAQRARR